MQTDAAKEYVEICELIKHRWRGERTVAVPIGLEFDAIPTALIGDGFIASLNSASDAGRDGWQATYYVHRR